MTHFIVGDFVMHRSGVKLRIKDRRWGRVINIRQKGTEVWADVRIPGLGDCTFYSGDLVRTDIDGYVMKNRKVKE